MVSCLSLFHGERFVPVATRDFERFRHECLRFWVSNFISIEVVSGMYCSTPICKRSRFSLQNQFIIHVISTRKESVSTPFFVQYCVKMKSGRKDRPDASTERG